MGSGSPHGAREPGHLSAKESGVRALEVEHLGRVGYEEALELQRDRVVRRRAGEIGDRLMLLEHPHVITMGSSASDDHVVATPGQRSDLGIELHEVGRGGDVTYHGPGQRIGYPIFDLKPDRKDLHAYLRDLEEVLIRAVTALGFGGARRREGMTGVWLPQGKVAAIGIRVSSGWITSHGFALNVSTDLTYFDTIVPCGIADESVTSLERVRGAQVPMDAVDGHVVEAFQDVFGFDSTIHRAASLGSLAG